MEHGVLDVINHCAGVGQPLTVSLHAQVPSGTVDRGGQEKGVCLQLLFHGKVDGEECRHQSCWGVCKG